MSKDTNMSPWFEEKYEFILMTSVTCDYVPLQKEGEYYTSFGYPYLLVYKWIGRSVLWVEVVVLVSFLMHILCSYKHPFILWSCILINCMFKNFHVEIFISGTVEKAGEQVCFLFPICYLLAVWLKDSVFECDCIQTILFRKTLHKHFCFFEKTIYKVEINILVLEWAVLKM